MKRLQRVTAFILAVILAVHGLPATSIARAAYSAGNEAGSYTDASGDQALAEETERRKKMRFVQTGFDEKTGILTMSLQIKLEPGDKQDTISEGVFVFQTDADNVIPMTRPSANLQGVTEERKSFFLREGKVAIVADDSENGSKYVRDYLNSGRAEKISDTSFSLAMSNDRFLLKHTGYMVSSARAVGRESTGLLDCYFQFMYNTSEFPGWTLNGGSYERVWQWNSEQNRYESQWVWDSEQKKYVESDELNTDPGKDPNIAVDGSDLYINVMDFDFQCYSGYENGQFKPATSMDNLFSGSIKVPESAEEARSIMEQFSYEDESGEEVSMAMGGAGFISKYWNELEAQPYDDGPAYYYFEEPTLSKWRKNGSSRDSWSNGTAQLIEEETAPGLWYPNKDNKYVVRALVASVVNPISSLDDPIDDADFRIPLDSKGEREVETGRYPRYVIPKDSEPQDGIPKAYQMDNADDEGNGPKLEYHLGTEVSENSPSSPEKEDLAGFLERLEWGFVLPDSTPLDSIESLSENGRSVTVAVDTDEYGNEISKTITAASGQKCLVKDATITDVTEGSGNQASATEGEWNGTKLWEVYKVQEPAAGGDSETPQETYEYYMRSPVGVILDMDPATEILSYNVSGNAKTGIAPQLHVTKYAADPANYIWKSAPKGSAAAELQFRPMYKIANLELTDAPVTVRLYKEDSVVTSSDLQTERIGKVANAEGDPVDGFWVGKAQTNGTLTLDEATGKVTKDSNEEAEDTRQDALSTGVIIKSFLYDQYHIAFEDKKNEVKLVLETDPEEKKGPSPFEVVPVEGKTGWYTIKYKSGMGINDVVEGKYVLQATYDVIREPQIDAEPKTLYVKKPKSHFTYMDTNLTGDYREISTQEVEEPTEDGGSIKGKIIEVEYKVPERMNKATVSKYPAIQIIELANQWREPGVSLEDDALLQNYDIVPGIREAEGSAAISISKARTNDIKLNFELTYPGSEEGGEEPRGLTFGVEETVDGEKRIVDISESGRFTYNSDVLHETWFNCRITATYEYEEKKYESQFVEYRFKFVRDVDNLKLSGITVTPPTDPNSDHIRVPLPTEPANTVKVRLVMKDQYNSDLDQDYVLEAYAPGGSMNPRPEEDDYWPDYPDWGVYLYPDWGTLDDLPEGVDFNHENGTITVDSRAEDDVSFQIYGKLGSTESDPVTVRVVRDGSKPETVNPITYSKQGSSSTVTELESPGINNASDNVYKASVEVYNQYLKKLEPVETLPDVLRGYYKPTWTISKVTPASAKSFLDLNSFDGTLTVKRGAPNCTVTVKLRADTRYSSKSKTITLEVKRAKAIPESLTVVDTEATYPTADAILEDVKNASKALTAKGTTQYGDDQTFKQGEGDGDITLTWTLEAVEFLGPDGKGGYKLYRQKENTGTGQMEDTGDIVNESGSWVAWDSVVLTESGVLQFRSITTKEKMPLSVWVTASYGTTVSPLKEIKIDWDRTDVSQVIEIPNEYKYSTGIQIPGAGVPTEVPLKANVRNQYGVIIDTPVVWSAAAKVPGMELVKKADGSYAVQVDYTAVAGNTLQLTATCGNVSAALPITAIQNETLKVDSVVMTGMRDSSGKTLPFEINDGVREITIPLPAKTGKGYDSYKMVCSVLSQFRQPMSGDVTWEIKDATGGIEASFVDNSDETVKDIRISFTEDARRALAGDPVKTDVSFAVSAVCEGKPDADIKENTCVIHFMLADSEKAYAVPTVTSYGANPYLEEIGGVATYKPRVPEWGTEATKVELTATVYDQYGVAMPGEAEMQLLTIDPSLTFNGSVLAISSAFTGEFAIVRATPVGMPQALQSESEKQIEVYADPAYPFGLMIGESSVFDREIHYEDVSIPIWDSNTTYVKDEDTQKTLTLEAQVVNQREGVLDGIPGLYPVWEFADGEHEGVEFENPEPDGTVKGTSVTLKITNQAAKGIPNGQLEGVVALKVSTNSKTGGYFEKTVKVHLTRNRPTPTYLYIDGSDEAGEDKVGLKRPYAEDKTTVYQFKPVVYDQYGQPVDVPVDMDLDIEALKDVHDIRVEKIYKRGESEEKGNQPISYAIYWVEEEATETQKAKETLVAEFSRETGNVTLYTACSTTILLSLRLNAKYGDLPRKSLRVYNTQETSIPYAVRVNRSHGNFTVSGNSEPVSDYITPLVTDQYGQPFPLNRLLTVQWALYMPEKDENGEYVPYKDYDKEGHEKLPNDYLIVKKDVADRTYSTVLTVQPEQFYENKTAILQCVVSYMGGDRQVQFKIQDTLIKVSRPVVSGGGGVIASFNAGEYGKLVGASEIEVNIGEAPVNAPGVKTVIGYGFVGWTTDGVTVVDASQIPLYEDTAYVAVYKDITNTKFLEGYKDGTARPEAAVTRAEFITMLAQAIGGYDSTKNYGASYRDVAQGKWYANYIAFAKQKGLTSGYPDGTFRPNATITRAEAATLLAVAANLPEGKEGSFSDIKAGAWYAKSVEALCAAGIASGYPDGTYRPNSRITRAEAVRLIVMMTDNALNDLERRNIQEYAYCPFSDKLVPNAEVTNETSKDTYTMRIVASFGGNTSAQSVDYIVKNEPSATIQSEKVISWAKTSIEKEITAYQNMTMQAVLDKYKEGYGDAKIDYGKFVTEDTTPEELTQILLNTKAAYEEEGAWYVFKPTDKKATLGMDFVNGYLNIDLGIHDKFLNAGVLASSDKTFNPNNVDEIPEGIFKTEINGDNEVTSNGLYNFNRPNLGEDKPYYFWSYYTLTTGETVYSPSYTVMTTTEDYQIASFGFKSVYASYKEAKYSDAPGSIPIDISKLGHVEASGTVRVTAKYYEADQYGNFGPEGNGEMVELTGERLEAAKKTLTFKDNPQGDYFEFPNMTTTQPVYLLLTDTKDVQGHMIMRLTLSVEKSNNGYCQIREEDAYTDIHVVDDESKITSYIIGLMNDDGALTEVTEGSEHYYTYDYTGLPVNYTQMGNLQLTYVNDGEGDLEDISVAVYDDKNLTVPSKRFEAGQLSVKNLKKAWNGYGTVDIHPVANLEDGVYEAWVVLSAEHVEPEGRVMVRIRQVVGQSTLTGRIYITNAAETTDSDHTGQARILLYREEDVQTRSDPVTGKKITEIISGSKPAYEGVSDEYGGKYTIPYILNNGSFNSRGRYYIVVERDGFVTFDSVSFNRVTDSVGSSPMLVLGTTSNTYNLDIHLRGGDVNQDEEITDEDLNLLAQYYNRQVVQKEEGEPLTEEEAYIKRCDFNQDGMVNALDRAYLISNLGMTGKDYEEYGTLRAVK